MEKIDKKKFLIEHFYVKVPIRYTNHLIMHEKNEKSTLGFNFKTRGALRRLFIKHKL